MITLRPAQEKYQRRLVAKHKHYPYTGAELQELYWDIGLSMSEIGVRLNRSIGSIRGAMVRFAIPRRSLSQANRKAKLGENNPNWHGVRAQPKAGRKRAWRNFSARPCQVCGNTRSERHHSDGNPLNNVPENVVFLCRAHHMEVDGRMSALRGMAQKASMARWAH